MSDIIENFSISLVKPNDWIIREASQRKIQNILVDMRQIFLRHSLAMLKCEQRTPLPNVVPIIQSLLEQWTTMRNEI